MQAARGTSVTTDRRPRYRRTFALVALVAYAVDLGTKLLAVRELDGRPDVRVVGDVLQLHLTRNPGAAFSTGTGITPLISVVAILAALAVLWYSRRLGNTGWAVALGILLAGITGNLTDRLFRDPGPLRGHVVDFLQLPNWPIFNVADICINIAAGLIIIQSFRGIHLDGTRGPEDEPADAASEATTSEKPENDDHEPVVSPVEERAE